MTVWYAPEFKMAEGFPASGNAGLAEEAAVLVAALAGEEEEWGLLVRFGGLDKLKDS